MIELVIELLAEVVFAGAGEGLIEGLARLIGASFGRTDRQHPVLAGIGLLMMGAAVGGISAWARPYQVAGNGPIPGISLVVSPLANGLALEAIGRWRDRHRKPRTYLSTFWDAATFAFAVAAVRFWLVGGR